MNNIKDLSILQQLLNIQKGLFHNVLDGISNEDSEKRPNDNTNNMKWIAGHTVSSRHFMLNLLGSASEYKYEEYFGGGKSFDPNKEYPALSDAINGWDELNDQLNNAIQNVNEEILKKDAPWGEGTVLDTFVFLVHHEAYHIGQLGILRKVLGFDSMKY
jgi:uncharacterized damage-inducible protein DinB